jgi:hypothetical protein
MVVLVGEPPDAASSSSSCSATPGSAVRSRRCCNHVRRLKSGLRQEPPSARLTTPSSSTPISTPSRRAKSESTKVAIYALESATGTGGGVDSLGKRVSTRHNRRIVGACALAAVFTGSLLATEALGASAGAVGPAASVTTVPAPDPPPVTRKPQPKPKPTPRPAHVAPARVVAPPPPPPPSPPAPVVASPPPAPVQPQKSKLAPRRHNRVQQVRHVKRVTQLHPRARLARPAPEQASAAATAPVAPSSGSLRTSLALLLVIALLTLSTLLIIMAAVPPRLLPARLGPSVARRRGDLATVGVTGVICLLLGFLISGGA